jgi:hypothetical protein
MASTESEYLAVQTPRSLKRPCGNILIGEDTEWAWYHPNVAWRRILCNYKNS